MKQKRFNDVVNELKTKFDRAQGAINAFRNTSGISTKFVVEAIETQLQGYEWRIDELRRATVRDRSVR